ncbi:helix-turn-helix domain-containing protein [Natrialbaceae archaeon A-gly3]
MRYLEVSLQQPLDKRHPIHQLVVEHESYDTSRLLDHHQDADNEHTLLFHLEGPRSPCEKALENMPSILEFEFAPCRDDTVYLYIRELLTKPDQIFVDAVFQPGLIAVPPIELRSDGMIRLKAIGPFDSIQATVENVSDLATVDILSVGEFHAGQIDSRAALTQRQFEAVSVAVECGYYCIPREGSLEDIAARLECSTGTAGELLRRAERTVMTRLVEGKPFSAGI